MAQTQIQVTPIPNRSGAPVQDLTDDGTRYAAVTLTISTGQTYSTTDQCVLVFSGANDFYSQFGSRIIKNVVAEDFACNNVSYGAFKLQWNADTQKGALRRLGNGGSVAPTGPLDEAEVANATALGAGLMTANAVIFW